MGSPRCLSFLLHALITLVLIPSVVVLLSVVFGPFMAQAEGWTTARGIWYSAGAFTITSVRTDLSKYDTILDDNLNETKFWEALEHLEADLTTMERPVTLPGCLAALVLHLAALGFTSFELAVSASLPLVSVLAVFLGSRRRHLVANIASFIFYTGILTPLLCMAWAIVLAPLLTLVAEEEFGEEEFGDQLWFAWMLALGNLTRAWSLDPLSERPLLFGGRIWHTYISCNRMVIVMGFMVGVMRRLRMSRMVANVFIHAAQKHRGWICRLGRPFICLEFIGIPMSSLPMLLIVAPILAVAERWTADQAVTYVASSITLMPVDSNRELGIHGMIFDLIMSCLGAGFFALSVAVISELPMVEALIKQSGVREKGCLPPLKAYLFSSFVFLPLAFSFIALAVAPILMLLECHQNWDFKMTWLHIVDMMLLSPGTMTHALQPSRRFRAKTLLGRIISQFCQFWSLSLALGNGIAIWMKSNPVKEIVDHVVEMSGDNPEGDELPDDMGIFNADGSTFYPQNEFVSNIVRPDVCTCCQDSDSDEITVDPDGEQDFRNRQFLAAYMSLNMVLQAWMDWELSDNEALKHANYFVARIQWLGDIDTDIARNLLNSQGLTDKLRCDIERNYEELVRHCRGC